MGEQENMLNRTFLVCLLVSLSSQKEIQKNDTDFLQGSYQNPRQEEYQLRSRRSTNLPRRITFRTEVAMTKRMLNAFNGNKRQAEKWVLEMVRAANRIFRHSSLDTQLTIEVMNIGNIKIVRENMEMTEDKLYQYKAQYLGNKYPLGVFGFTSEEGVRGFSYKRGELLAHEIGHVLGMTHNENTKKCSRVDWGVMNTITPWSATQWTSCNNKDLRRYYKNYGHTCL